MREPLSLRWIAVLAGGALALVLLLLLVAQLVLPGIATQRLRDRLARSGTVVKLEVHAFPAIELLWHQADRVVVHMGSYASDRSTLSSNLAQAANVGTLDVSADRFNSGLLTLRDATLRKRGSELSGTATLAESDLRSALPILDSLQLVSSAGGQVTLRGTATVFGVTATVDAVVQPQHGALVVTPNVPFGSLATITVFSDPAVAVRDVSAASTPGGLAVSARARLR